MAEHTPGPWRVANNASRRVTNEHGVVICNAVLRNSGSAKGGARHGAKEVLEAEANASLIAAAPEMLKALSNAVALHEMSFGVAFSPDHWTHAARAALAKARGVS